jgi:hypothetical protein
VLSITVTFALAFQALVLAPMALTCCEPESSVSNSDCHGHAGKAEHRCPCCVNGTALSCAATCAGVAIPVTAVAMIPRAPHTPFTPFTAATLPSQKDTPPDPPPIA